MGSQKIVAEWLNEWVKCLGLGIVLKLLPICVKSEVIGLLKFTCMYIYRDELPIPEVFFKLYLSKTFSVCPVEDQQCKMII